MTPVHRSARYLVLGTFLLSASVAVACGSGSDNRPTPTAAPPGTASPAQTVRPTVQPSPSPTARPTPTAIPPAPVNFYKAGTRSGEAVVDRALAAFDARSASDLQAQVQLYAVPCREAEFQGFPQCPAGTPANSPVQASFSSVCDIGWAPATIGSLTNDTAVARFFAQGPYLHSIVKLKPTAVPIAEGFFPPMRWVVVFSGGPAGTGETSALGLDDKGIAWVAIGCTTPVDRFRTDTRIGTFDGYLFPPRP